MNDANRSSVGHYRWVICALLFFATTINYVDRVGVRRARAGTSEKIIGWTATQFGNINASFKLAYAIGFLFAGWMMDKLGTRLGYAISLIVWSLAAAAMHLPAASGVLPPRDSPWASASREISRPRSKPSPNGSRKRSGPSPRAFSTPAPTSARFSRRRLFPTFAEHYGWQAAFIATGLIGLIWVFFWWPIYRRPQEHPQLSPAELAYIESDPPDPPIKIRWLQLLPFRQTWAFAIGKFLTDAVWWFYLFWFAKFMSEQFGVNIKTIGAADDHRLLAGRHRLDCRRLAKLLADGPRLDDQRGPQNRHADLRDLRRARRLRAARRKHAALRLDGRRQMDRRLADRRWPPPPIRDSPATCSRSPPTCSRAAWSVRWSASAVSPARWAAS